MSIPVDKKKVIWIFDAGMMEAGGHHAALAETLCQAKVRQPDISIKVFAHKLLDEHLRKRFAESDISTVLSFDSVFYKHFHDGAVLGPAGLQKYIRLLSLEYKQLLEQAIKHANQQSVIVFLPCLNWEHANALEFAINQLKVDLNTIDINLVACAMYSPTASDHESDIKNLWYKMAFKALAKYQFVSLYCSEQELSDTYADLLSLNEMPVHPCYLMDWAGIYDHVHQDAEQYHSGNSKRYLLYMGDAKVDKGFNRLPEVLQQGLAATDSETNFVIQFTLAWEYPEIMTTIDVLKRCAQTEPRLKLHHGFLSNQSMVDMIRQMDGIICTYDANAYQYKSSGLVWMLAFFNKPLILSNSCWLSREASRLSVPVAVDKSFNVRAFSQGKQAPPITGYANQLFMPLIEWLLSH